MGLASVYYFDKQYDAAITHLSKLINANYNDNDYYHLRGLCYFFYSEKYSEAVIDYSHSIELNPDNSVLYNDRGAAYFLLNKYDLAIQDLTQSINSSNNIFSFYWRGKAYYETKQYDKALVDFDVYLSKGTNKDNLKEIQELSSIIRK